MRGLISLWLALANVHTGPVNHGIGSTFDTPARDRFNNGVNACTGKPMKHSDRGVASWWLPCNARVLIKNDITNQIVVAPVIDRGPRRGARRHPTHLDLSAATAADIGATGWTKITWVELR